jgi:hypothetical protein
MTHVPQHEGVWRSGGIVLGILNLGTRWRWVVSFTLRLFLPSRYHHFGKRSSWDSVETTLRTERPGLTSRKGQWWDFFFSVAFRTVVRPTQPPKQWVPGALTRGVKRPGVKLTTHLHVLPRLRMRGGIPSLPQCIFMALCFIKQEIRLHGVVLS